VIIEAITRGVPVVCTDTGGLDAYFSASEIRYVRPGDPDEVRRVVDELARDEGLRHAMTAAAQRRLHEADLSSRGHALRRRKLTEELLAGAPLPVPMLIQARDHEAVFGDEVVRSDRPVRPAAASADVAPRVRVFVFLAHGFGRNHWPERYAKGLIAGVNDSYPYGYHRAAGDGWIVEYSTDAEEPRPQIAATPDTARSRI